MPNVKQIIFTSAFVCALLATAAAQESPTASAQKSSLTITAAAAGDRVRIAAPSSVVQMHLEVYASSGERLFDQEIRGGNVFDWHLQDGQGQRLAAGTYVCVVTAKSISGKLTQKIGTVSVEEKSVSVQPAASTQLSAPQAQTIGPVEDNSSWTIAGKDELQTPTVIANDGTDGQMIRGRGALTFRIGNFFTGNDTEQMRLTEGGNLGIGTSDPQAKLDVAGTIRAQRFLIVKPKVAVGDKSTTESLVAAAPDSVQPLASGTGTQDRIAKWTDNAGALGDSIITESANNIGIGTTTPGSKLVVSSNSATLPPASGIARFADADGVQTAIFADAFGTNPLFNVRRANGTATAPSALQANQLLGVIGASGYGASAYMGTRARVGFFASENWTNTANGTYLTFNTTANGAATPGGMERMRIDNAGNVGIGTPSPTERLHVAQSGDYQLRLDNPASGGGFWNIGQSDTSFHSGGGKLLFVPNTIESTNAAVAFTTAGNVGIGTINPSAKLSVEGSATISGNVTISGNATISGDATFSGSINRPVGIGVPPQSGDGLSVRGPDSTANTTALDVANSDGLLLFIVRDDGSVSITTAGAPPASMTHACYASPLNRTFTTCNSAAEYVPTIDNGSGYAQTADLVSIAPATKNPYGDAHSPFVVTKSTKPYDDNLIGFILKPESGADGKKLNEHYLPLAIYGYFPAKVTMENGAIKRGDPITSSSKPGYGMKATQACKIVGYALEDATQDGTIQVFAHQGEYTAPQVAALRAQLAELQRQKSAETEALKAQRAALEARLAALEQAVQRSTENSSLVTPRRSAYCGAKRKSTRTASRRLVHSRAITKSRTLSSGL